MPKCYQPFYLKSQNMLIPCGKCLNCQSNKKRELAHRASVEIEKMNYKEFITLTYNDLEMPTIKNQMSLDEKQITDYIKRLDISQKRHYRAEGIESKMKYFIAGEYSPTVERPHYHMVVGSNTPIKYNARILWDKGNAFIEPIISRKAISYAVGYTQKKQWETKYKDIQEPFHKFSKGIGKNWFLVAWQNGDISTEKFYIENHNYIMSVGAYYKYLLRKKFYDYKDKENEDTLSKFIYGRNAWQNFQKEIINNIEKASYDITEDTATNIIKKNIISGSYYDFKKAVENKLVKKKDYELLINDIIAYKNNKANKQLKYDAEAKFWMRACKRKDIA